MRSSRYAFTVPSLGIAGLATVLLLGAAPAFAQDTSSVEILATIDKTITQSVDETINITKAVTLDAKVNVKASKFAESDTSVSQVNEYSSACENCAERTDTLNSSANGNAGIVTVNEAGGNLNNQAATISAAIDVDGTTPDPTNAGFAEASASATQMNNNNDINVVSILFRDALITNSIHNNSGIAYVNQSVGNINNQANELSLAFSKKPEGVALSEADLGQFNAGNGDGSPQTVSESSVTKSAAITGGSISNNTGIVGVNQASGNFANQANIVSFAAVMP